MIGISRVHQPNPWLAVARPDLISSRGARAGSGIMAMIQTTSNRRNVTYLKTRMQLNRHIVASLLSVVSADLSMYNT